MRLSIGRWIIIREDIGRENNHVFYDGNYRRKKRFRFRADDDLRRMREVRQISGFYDLYSTVAFSDSVL